MDTIFPGVDTVFILNRPSLKNKNTNEKTPGYEERRQVENSGENHGTENHQGRDRLIVSGTS